MIFVFLSILMVIEMGIEGICLVYCNSFSLSELTKSSVGKIDSCRGTIERTVSQVIRYSVTIQDMCNN